MIYEMSIDLLFLLWPNRPKCTSNRSISA